MSLVMFTIALTSNTPLALEINSTSISGDNERVVLSVLVKAALLAPSYSHTKSIPDRHVKFIVSPRQTSTLPLGVRKTIMVALKSQINLKKKVLPGAEGEIIIKAHKKNPEA